MKLPRVFVYNKSSKARVKGGGFLGFRRKLKRKKNRSKRGAKKKKKRSLLKWLLFGTKGEEGGSDQELRSQKGSFEFPLFFWYYFRVETEEQKKKGNEKWFLFFFISWQ